MGDAKPASILVLEKGFGVPLSNSEQVIDNGLDETNIPDVYEGFDFASLNMDNLS